MPTLYTRNALALRAIATERGLPCVHCGLDIEFSAPARSRWSWSADHKVPKSLGGSDELSNLQPAHYSCNSARGNGITRGRGSHNGLRRSVPITRSPHSERWP